MIFFHVFTLNASIRFQKDSLKDSTRITPGQTFSNSFAPRKAGFT